MENEINRGFTEKAQDAILMTSSHRQKCLWPRLLALPCSQRHREKEMRATEKLCTCNWPAAFELRVNFNLDKLTSRICGQAPKRYPKWRRPMMNFLLLWRGISLGSNALWKLKQRSVTQISVAFLLVSTKIYGFWSDLLL